MTDILITAGHRSFQARLCHTRAAEELYKRLPLTLEMQDLHANEKYHYLPAPLTTDTQYPGRVNAGELMLFGDNCLVLFYDSFRTSYGYTRLGRITDPAGLAQALGKGNVTVRITKANATKSMEKNYEK